MKYCANCGTKLDDDAKFCLNCGSQQEVAEQNPKQTSDQESRIQNDTRNEAKGNILDPSETADGETQTQIDNSAELESQQVLTESDGESDSNNYEAYIPPVPADEVSDLDRQGTMDVLAEAEEIADEYEDYNSKIAGILKKIDEERKKADELRKRLSEEAKKKIAIITIAVIVLGMVVEAAVGRITGIMSIIFGILAFYFSYKIISISDLKKNEKKNNAIAEEYILEHVGPLQEQLNEIYAFRDNLLYGGKYEWVIDLVGEDLFFSVCISDLYDLIKSRRADNLKEALNKYDDTRHKARMEQMQRAIQQASEATAAEAAKQTEYARQTAASARATARNTEATARNTRATARNTRATAINTWIHNNKK